jgi:hypothetical protein
MGDTHLDLSDDEAAALAQRLKRAIDRDRHPPSRAWRPSAILAKLRPEPAREPTTPPKVYAPPRAALARKRHRR